MEYASSYALQNFRRVNGSAPNKLGDPKEWETDNLRVIRAFEDADGSEAGFVLVHVRCDRLLFSARKGPNPWWLSMAAYTGRCVTSVEAALAAANAGDRKAFNVALASMQDVYEDINRTMETMWSSVPLSTFSAASLIPFAQLVSSRRLPQVPQLYLRHWSLQDEVSRSSPAQKTCR